MRTKKSTSREVAPSNGAAENVVEEAVVESVAALEPIAIPVLALKAAISCTGAKTTDVNGDKKDVPENLQGVNIATREGEVRVSATDGHRLFAYSIPSGSATLPGWLGKGITVPLALFREQLMMIEKLGGDSAVISYGTGAPRLLLSDPHDNVTFRLFPVEGDFPAYDGMFASINLSSRETLDLESTGYQAAYLKGVADLAKLLESPTVQVFGAGDDKPTLIMFPGCPGAVLALMPVMGLRDQALAPQQARILNPAITGTIGALRANRTRTMARLEKMPNNRLLQKKIEDYDQRINTLITRTQPQTALPAPAPSPQLLDEDEAETTDDGDTTRVAQRAKLKGAPAKKARAKFFADVNAVLSRDNAGLTIHQLADGVPLDSWWEGGLTPEVAATRCLGWRQVETVLSPDKVVPGEGDKSVSEVFPETASDEAA